jgi:alpha,alpha-trehalase
MKGKKAILNFTRSEFDALLFDLDGVITKTARVHALSWKKLFDQYIRDNKKIPEEQRRPFDITEDYLNFVDGKPRYEGVRSFLASRGIDLPWGTPEDPPGSETICGLGNRKNLYFQEHLKNEGVEVYKGARELLQLLREGGFKTGVVSSSRNCSTVIEAAGLRDLFDIQVDGLVSADLGLKGKPDPDTFLYASGQLHAEPSRTAIFEDALSGVQAGSRGNFGCVIGVDQSGQEEELIENGADLVVSDLSCISVEGDFPVITLPIGTIPNAMDNIDELARLLEDHPLFIALDYDGTLTPIVDRPELAILPEKMRDTLEKLAQRYNVAIISGRDVRDIRNFIKLDEIIYAGSHGFDISSPPGTDLDFQIGEDFLPILNRTEKQLEENVRSIEGALIERKKFSIALHYRLVKPERIREIESMVDEILDKEPKLKKGLGKKVFELKPSLEWDKGQALLWLMKGLGMSTSETLPIYIGDDITDEDAFRVLQNTGLGIVVRDGEQQRPSMAEYSLLNTLEVGDFLKRLVEMADKGGRS